MRKNNPPKKLHDEEDTSDQPTEIVPRSRAEQAKAEKSKKTPLPEDDSPE